MKLAGKIIEEDLIFSLNKEPCPEGCPDMSKCRLTVVLNYSGASVTHIDNQPVSSFGTPTSGNPNGSMAGWGCMIDTYIEDQNAESGGDIGIYLNLGYDSNCNPTIADQIVGISQDSNKGSDECLNPQNYGYAPGECPPRCGCDDPCWIAWVNQGLTNPDPSPCPTVEITLQCDP